MDTLCPYVSVSDGTMVLALILLDTFQDTGLTYPLKKKGFLSLFQMHVKYIWIHVRYTKTNI